MSVTVTIKPIKGDIFKVDVDGSAKVADLKQKIAAAKPDDFPVEVQKLIFTGKILQDDTTIQDVGLKPDSFIVCMSAGVKRKTEAPAAAATPAAPAADAAQAAPAAPAAAEPTPMATDTPAQTTPPEQGPLPTVLTDLKNNPKWNELARVVSRDPSVLNRMLPALGRWPDVRNGIVENIQGFVIMCRIEAGVHETTPMPAMSVGRGGGPGGGGNAAALMQALAQNPQMMQQMMQELPPEMQQMARENPSAFASMLSQIAGGAGGPGMGGMGGGGGGMPVPAELTEADNAAVERLTALGFDKAQATQAYFACDKNEELAVNFLLDGGGDEPMPDQGGD